MKKVLVYAHQLLPYSQTFVRDQVTAMKSWKPILIGERLEHGGLDIEALDVRVLSETGESLWERKERRVCQWLRWPYRKDLERLRGENAQLLHIHFATHATLVWPYAKALNLPVLVTLHGYDINTHRNWWEAGKGGQTMRDYPEQMLRMAQDPLVFFVAVSHAVRERAIEFGVPAEKIVVRYIGVDTKRFQPNSIPLRERSPRVLFVGRQVEKKGTGILIRAFCEVQRCVPGAKLVIIGDGPLKEANQTLADSLGVRAEFLGALPSEAVKAEMDRAQVFCLPSITAENGDAEGLPISILEAQASGVPVVITKSGGSDEAILDGVTGLCCSDHSPQQVGECLVRILSDEEKLEVMGAEARAFMLRNFDLSDCTMGLENFYSSYVARGLRAEYCP